MKSTRTLAALLAVALCAGLAACSGGEKASWDQLETQRGVANDNARYNATKWRAENGYETLGLLTRGDSTQQLNCTQGDGWASVDLTDPKTKQPVVKLKCSTVSSNLGCFTEGDFKSRKQYAGQENICNADLPKTLKKIEG